MYKDEPMEALKRVFWETETNKKDMRTNEYILVRDYRKEEYYTIKQALQQPSKEELRDFALKIYSYLTNMRVHESIANVVENKIIDFFKLVELEETNE